MKGNDAVWKLVRVGASVAANCTACLEYHALKAQECGVDTELIDRAIRIGLAVGKGAASRFEKDALKLTATGVPVATAGEDPGCGCR